MALVTKKRIEELPEDAVILSQDQALTYSVKLIEGWKNVSDVWAIRYAPAILGSISGLTGIYINNHYRKKLKLGNFGKFSSYIPIVALPAIMTAVTHRAFVQKDVILRPELCPVCLQTRAGILQLGFSTIYPTLLAPLAALMFATRHYTYRLPSITSNPKEVLDLVRKMTKPLTGFLAVSIFAHTAFAMGLTYLEMNQFYTLQNELLKMENDIDVN